MNQPMRAAFGQAWARLPSARTVLKASRTLGPAPVVGVRSQADRRQRAVHDANGDDMQPCLGLAALADKAAPRSVSSASSGSMEGLLGSAGGLSS